MRQSRPKDVKSLFGSPPAQSGLSQGTSRSGSKLETSLSAAGTTLQLTKDAGDAASHVPYVKAVAGVLSQIIRIRDEIKANSDRCEEIINLVQLKSITILQSLDKLYETKGAEGFEDLKSDLEAYADFLQAVLKEELEPFKKQPRWTSYINRGKNAGDLQRLERELNEFKDRFSIKRLVHVEMSVALLSQPVPQVQVIPQALPSCPKLVFGRDFVVESVVQATLSSPEPRVVILGQGGIGKTTIATIVLHDSRITSAYPTIYFVSSEPAPTAEILEIRLADALFIPQSDRGTDLISQIVDRICKNAHPVLLYIDNLETVWEVESEQQKVDQFLEVLSGAGSKLALLVTMRGIQEPKTSFPWDPTILPGLDIADSVVMYENLSGKSADGSARELLLKLSGSPLAIKLFSLMVKEGDKPSELLSSWEKHGVKTLEIGGKHRLSSLEQSIHLSVFSPRIDDTARLVLGLIALMPDGLSTCSPWFEGFESTLPNKTILQPVLRALRRTALLGELGEPSRWQMLPPIRQFCLQLVDSMSISTVSLVELYIETVIEHYDFVSSTSQSVILPEMTNIRGLLLHGSNLRPLPSFIGSASAYYANWAYWQDIDDSAILPSFLCLPIPKGQQAYIYQMLGKLHLHWDRLDEASASLISALQLSEEVQDQRGEANARTTIGDIYMRRNQLVEAGVSLARALELYGEVQDRWGEANTHRSIGELHMSRGQLKAAQVSFTLALELYGELQNRLGEANTYGSIGDLHMRQSQLDSAEASFNHALELYSKIQDRLGEANIKRSIGRLHMRRNQLDTAETEFTRALELYGELQNKLGEADTHKSIGDLLMRRDQLDAVEISLTRAIELYGELRDRAGQANTHKSIGHLHLRRDQPKAAKVSFTCALEQYNEMHDKWGIATCTFFLGQACLRNQELEAADSAFSLALTLREELGDIGTIAEVQQAIGDLHLQRMQLGDAEASLNLAYNIYTTKVKSRRFEALTNRSIGELHLLHGLFEDSERAFRRALDLEIAAGRRVGQGQSHRGLGRMFMKMGDLNAAESSYADALRLFLEIKDYQATPCLLDIGKVWVLQGKIKESEALDVVLLRTRWDAEIPGPL
ncbi:hypothetical protein DL96DRAFT_1819129 [Flagelloscypha sp. PMI_526]|nr:hypothetical protein DL96DRAFT_1819129 [Flagelloscypha sp. PMI_526]